MNVYDSNRMADTLAPEGFVETATAEHADLVILNTCHIREKAADKVYSELGRLRALKQDAASEGRRMMVAVAGCVAQAEGEEIVRRARDVDIVVGPQSYHRLPDLVARATRGEAAVVDTEFPPEDKFAALKAPAREAIRARGVSAFVTVQEGCDKFCTFCVVPYTRGAEMSRPVAGIVAEVERLADAGVRDVTLIGQNVNAYHGVGADGRAWSFGRLLHRLAEVPGIARLRYTTSHPCDMEDSLIAAHRDLPALMPLLHLPVQSGSDRILAAMNRRHTVADYLDTVERVRAARPDLALTSDFIVGFPGETEDGFRRDAGAGREGRICQRIYVQIFAPARDPGGRDGRPGLRGGQIRPSTAPSGRHRPAIQGISRGLRRPDVRCSVRTPRPPSWSIRRPLPISPAGAGDRAGHHDWGYRQSDHFGRQCQQPVRRTGQSPRAGGTRAGGS